jgi:hypothetical protein
MKDWIFGAAIALLLIETVVLMDVVSRQEREFDARVVNIVCRTIVEANIVKTCEVLYVGSDLSQRPAQGRFQDVR